MKPVYRLLITLFICTALLFTATAAENPAPAANTTPPTNQPQQSRLWNLQDADILSVINEVSLETGKNFVVDPRVTGKISLISSKPVNPEEVYDVFLSVLSMLGYSAVPSGNVIKIVPNMESGEYATRVATKNTPGKGDEVVVRIFPLENVSANQLIPIIRPMLPQWGNVSAYAPGNVLILLGRASNLERIIRVIHNLDTAAENNIEIVPLHQSSAQQMATVLTNLQNASRAQGDPPQVSIAPDERSNSILLSGNKTARMHMRFLISKLDLPSSGSLGNTQVVYLRYLEARKVAPLLGKIAQNMLGKNTAAETVTTTPSSTPVSNAPAKTTLPENFTNIQAEPSTNSLIIIAPPALMQALTAVIAKLDIRPSQVLVEAIIVEMDQSDTQALGIQWGGLPSTNPTPTANGGIPFAGIGIGTVGIIPRMQIQAVLSALQNITGANILSTPTVVVLDNQRAILEVGKDVPEQSGSYATTGNTSTVNPFNTIVRRKVALRLEVTPQINLGNAIRLKLAFENDTLQDPSNPGPNPIINISKIANSVLVNSQDILVLGGLISNTFTETLTKVPILGDIPIVGKAFQNHGRDMQRKNLMVFIKPIILHTSEEAECLTFNKYNRSREAEINFPEKSGNQKMNFIMPPWKNDVILPKPFEPCPP